jgi:membrane-associated phospholipid phosphatase
VASKRADHRTATAKPTETEFAKHHPRAFLGVYGVAGLVLAAASTWIFFVLADEVPENGWMVRIDNSVTNWLQAHGTELGESVFWTISLLGAPVLIALLVLITGVLVYGRNWRRLAALAITCGGGALLNVALKMSMQRARPSFASEFHARSWSFPSGHAMDSAIVYGFLAHWAVRRWPRRRTAIILTAATIVVAIGYARVYLGVHFLSDVVAGYCAGSVWLVVCVTGFRFAERRRIGAGSE